jgi:hypothetical protein
MIFHITYYGKTGVQSVSDLGELPFNLRGEGYVIFLKKIF